MISIIIPTLNEEKYLPKLLESIEKQTYKNYEIIVADSNSHDCTREIAKKYGCKIVLGGKPGPARNHGAKSAKGDTLLFIDADVEIPKKTFFRDAISELAKRKLDVAGVYVAFNSKHIADLSYCKLLNFWFYIMQYFYPHCVGACIMVKKSVHKDLKGFDEGIVLAEDNDYVNRAGKKFRFRMLNNWVYFSARRLEKEGRIKMGIKYTLIFFYRVLFGEIRTDIFRYRFGHYEK